MYFFKLVCGMNVKCVLDDCGTTNKETLKESWHHTNTFNLYFSFVKLWLVIANVVFSCKWKNVVSFLKETWKDVGSVLSMKLEAFLCC